MRAAQNGNITVSGRAGLRAVFVDDGATGLHHAADAIGEGVGPQFFVAAVQAPCLHRRFVGDGASRRCQGHLL